MQGKENSKITIRTKVKELTNVLVANQDDDGSKGIVNPGEGSTVLTIFHGMSFN